MKKLHYFVLFLLLISAVFGCQRRIHTDFSFSPEHPKIGDSVFFVNLSAGGEDFDWTFRNNTTGAVTRSTLESPIRVFTTPGAYSATLRVDSNDNNVRTRHFQVFDSIPFIARNKETVEFFSDVTFRAVAYNPTGRTRTFEWHFSLNAEGDNLTLSEDETFKISTVAEPTVFFTKRLAQETVKLRMTIGDSVYTMQQIPHERFIVEDVAARSLLMAQKDGKILRQRIFERGTDDVEATNINAGKHPFNIISIGEQLFIFDAGTNIQENANWETDTNGDGNIRVFNLINGSSQGEIVISNTGTSSYFGFYNGYADADNIYWTDRNDFVYRLPINARNETFQWLGLANQNTLPYFVANANLVGNGMAQGQFSGGIHYRNGIYYWAKGGSGKGLYRFTKNGDQITSLPTRLPDYAIRSFVFDWNANLIYFAATASPQGAGLFVANSDGTMVQLIDNAPMDNPLEYITGLVIDRTAGRLLWAYRAPAGSGHKSGVKQIKLLQSGRERPETPTYFNYEEGIYGITLDNNLSYSER